MKAAAPMRGGSWLWVQGLLCGALLAFATGSAVLLGMLLAPAGLAFLMDGSPGKRMARSVLFAGLAFAIGPVCGLWGEGGTVEAALGRLGQPSVLLPAWLAAACGWALCELLPAVLVAGGRWTTSLREAALRAELAALREEWDLEGSDPGA